MIRPGRGSRRFRRRLAAAVSAALDSRLLTRAMIVVGILGWVFVSQIERAVRTAYSSHWVALDSGSELRLPTPTWTWVFPLVGVASMLLLLGAVRVWRRRERTAQGGKSLGLRKTTRYLSLSTVALSLAAAGAQWYAADGRGEGALTVATMANLLAVACVVGLALATGNLLYYKLGGLKRVAAGVLQRQRMNLLVAILLAVVLLFVGQTSGQSVDSMRSWAPIVLGTDDRWSGTGTVRLLLGLAAALMLAVALYESGTRLNRLRLDMNEPKQRWLLGVGAATSVVGLIALVVPRSPFGPGLLIGGLIVLLISAFEVPHVPWRELPPSSGLLTRAELNTPEWIAITPLLALAAVSVTAAAEAMLSTGFGDGNAWLTLVPAVVLGALAILMTRRRPTTPPGLNRVVAAAVGVGVVLLSVVFLVIALTWLDEYADWWMAVYGAAWLVALGVYTFRVFHGHPVPPDPAKLELELEPTRDDVVGHDSEEPTVPIALGPIALGGGFAVFVAVHARPIAADQLLGVFTLVLVALAFALPFLHLAVRTTLRLRPPRVLAWFGFRQLPVLTLLVLWWILVGVAQTSWGRMSALHDARLVERSEVGRNTGAAGGRAAPTLREYFDEWLAGQPDKAGNAKDTPIPLVLVAAHGGGIRAAYWTAAALDCVVGSSGEGVTSGDLDSDDEAVKQRTRNEVCRGPRRTRQEQQLAAKRIFMASGVSGGAVGLYAYARQLLEQGQLESAEQLRGDDWIDARLGTDFASPAIGWAFFHDVPNRLLGLHPNAGAACRWKLPGTPTCLTQDRAAVLEETFDDVWADPDSPDARLRGIYDLRFGEDHGKSVRAGLVPLLVMNATLTGGKTRAVVSAADLGSWPRADADDPERGDDRLPLAGVVEVRDALCESQDMRLSTAAFLASRFPYVTPSGRIGGRCGYDGSLRAPDAAKNVLCSHRPEGSPSCEGRYVDGGYIDNSGLASIVSVWPTLRALILEHNRNAARSGQRLVAPMIVELDNHYQKSIQATVPAGGSSAETLIPVETAFGGRTAVEVYARAAAYRILHDWCTVTISPALHPGLIAPLGWELSKPARIDLRDGLTNPHPADDSGMKGTRLLRLVQYRLTASARPKPGEVVGTPLAKCAPTE